MFTVHVLIVSDYIVMSIANIVLKENKRSQDNPSSPLDKVFVIKALKHR